MTLNRFLTLRGDELRSRYPDIFDTPCQELVYCLRPPSSKPNAKELLVDLIRRPSLLTPMSFVKGFLYGTIDKGYPTFLDYAWSEAIEEGLKREHKLGGERLWQEMKIAHPTQFYGDYPSTPAAVSVVIACFPTKQHLENQWGEENAATLYCKLNSLEFISNLFPDVLWSIIAGYATSWADI